MTNDGRRDLDDVSGPRSSALGPTFAHDEGLRLDERTAALVRVAALVALGSPQASYTEAVAGAVAAQATIEELIATLLTVAPVVGLSRTVSATPLLSLAVGYDLDAAFESLDPPDERPWG